MSFSYKKLFKLLIDLNLKQKDLCEAANISTTSVAKLKKGQTVNTEILDKICSALNCDISDIVEFEPDKQSEDDNHE